MLKVVFMSTKKLLVLLFLPLLIGLTGCFHADVNKAFEEAKKSLLGKPGIHGVSISEDRKRIIVYAEEDVEVPSHILGVPVEVVRTETFKTLKNEGGD